MELLVDWLMLIMIHGLACLFALIDAVGTPMTPRERASWLACVALLPVLGASLYILLGRRAGTKNDAGRGPGGTKPPSGC